MNICVALTFRSQVQNLSQVPVVACLSYWIFGDVLTVCGLASYLQHLTKIVYHGVFVVQEEPKFPVIFIGRGVLWYKKGRKYRYFHWKWGFVVKEGPKFPFIFIGSLRFYPLVFLAYVNLYVQTGETQS